MAEYIKKALVAREISKLLRVRESAVDIFQAGFEYGVNRAWIKINKIPAADVAPVVRGKWLNIDGDYTFAACSICKEDYEVATEEEAEKGLWGAFLSAYRYCPNCGAKMDGRVDR